MRRLSRFVVAAVLMAGLLNVFAVGPRPAAAQCGMGGGGAGHDHGVSQPAEKKLKASAKKQREAAAKLLADDQGRMMLMDALLEDRDFMWAFIPRIVAVAEWRDLVSLRINQASTAPPTITDKPSVDRGAAYACPMHADVQSAQPGSCSKCGMALRRQGSETGSR